MPKPQRYWLRRALALLAIGAAWLPAAAGAQAGPPLPEPHFIIEDNDFGGPGGSDLQSTLPLLANPDVTLLGFTIVTGDGWENEEAARLLRFLEIVGRTDVPVVNGAVYPLINSVARMRAWEQQYGTIPWKGAWGALGPIDDVPAEQPQMPKLDEGMPTAKASSELAAAFLIRQVHAHPHQVTIVAAGPLTNLALAIRLDPTFATDAKELVFMGALTDTTLAGVTGNANFASDFNMLFDPEAAHIVVTAGWPKITAVGNVSNQVSMTQALIDRIAAKKTPLIAYLRKYFIPLPLWDEMATAIAADPTLIKTSVEAYLDIDIAPGPDYGHAHLWSDATVPKAMGLRKVSLVQTIDTERFLDIFFRSTQIEPGH